MKNFQQDSGMDLLKAYIQVRYLGLGLKNRVRRGSYKVTGFIEM